MAGAGRHGVAHYTLSPKHSLVMLTFLLALDSRQSLCGAWAQTCSAKGSHDNSTPGASSCAISTEEQDGASLDAAPAISAADLYEPRCMLKGALDESNCTFEAVTELNAQVVNPLLQQIVRTSFFRYFKVNIYCDCPLWPDDSMCALRACSVCECDSSEVPQAWLHAEGQERLANFSGEDNSAHALAATTATALPVQQQPEQSSPSAASGRQQTQTQQYQGRVTAVDVDECDSAQCVSEQESRVDTTVPPADAARLVTLPGWRGLNNPWMAEGEEGEKYLYINLLANPERYTGYAGEHAHRIWHSIYSQSCFERVDCMEKQVFHRLISGMHSSISAHISANYMLDESGTKWGHNLTDFRNRLGLPEHRSRVENLYFAYLFVLRAVLKAGPLLSRYQFDTGSPVEDVQTSRLVTELVTSPAVANACSMPFDEGRLWKGSDALQLKTELQSAFQNITRIMDCVGCEKCKLWGKLQTLGVATALKILFSSPDCTGEVPTQPPFATLQLERNEVIALVNLLERFSASIGYYNQLAAEAEAEQQASSQGLAEPAIVQQHGQLH